MISFLFETWLNFDDFELEISVIRKFNVQNVKAIHYTIQYNIRHNQMAISCMEVASGQYAAKPSVTKTC